MKKQIGLLLLAGMSFHYSNAQLLHHPISSNYAGLGAYSASQADVFSFLANPAALAGIKRASIGIYGERKFLLNELNCYNAALALPFHSGNFGGRAVYSGFSDYNETELGLSYARSLGSRLDIGCTFNYNAISASGYGTASAMGAELGMIIHATKQLSFGICTENPTGTEFNTGDHEKPASCYSFGIGYDASAAFFISASIEKEEDQPVNVVTGAQYQFLSQLFLRGGISSANSCGWLGIGIRFSFMRIDISSTYHPQLGITAGLLVAFQLGSDEQNNKDANEKN